MKKTKRRLRVNDIGMVNALHRAGGDWVITSVPVEFAERVLEEEENVERSDGYTLAGDSWCFDTEEYTE